MNEGNIWLDERIRRGLRAWSPDVPKELDEGIKSLIRCGAALKDVETEPDKRQLSVWIKTAAAAAVILIAIFVFRPMGKPKAQSAPYLTMLPRPLTRPISLPLLELTLPKVQSAIAQKARAPVVIQPSVAARPRQIDMMVTIPDKGITIIWTQLEDFDLLTQSVKKMEDI